jgi:hypothetical protein
MAGRYFTWGWTSLFELRPRCDSTQSCTDTLFRLRTTTVVSQRGQSAKKRRSVPRQINGEKLFFYRPLKNKTSHK